MSSLWTISNLPIVRVMSGVVGVALNRTVFLGGGYVNLFNTHNNSWSSCRSYAENYIGAVVVDGSIYFGTYKGLDVLHRNGTWYSLSFPSSGEVRFDYTLVRVGRSVLTLGGSYLNTNYFVYDTTNDTWTTLPSNPSLFRNAAGVSIGNKACVGGGEGLYGRMDSVRVYSNGLSTVFQPLALARSHLSAVAVDNKVVFAGGQSPFVSDVVDIYDIDKDKKGTTKLSSERYNMAAIAVGSRAIFAGGTNRYYLPSPVVDIYDSSTDRWSTASIFARSNIVAVSVGQQGYFFGGLNILWQTRIDIYTVIPPILTIPNNTTLSMFDGIYLTNSSNLQNVNISLTSSTLIITQDTILINSSLQLQNSQLQISQGMVIYNTALSFYQQSSINVSGCLSLANTTMYIYDLSPSTHTLFFTNCVNISSEPSVVLADGSCYSSSLSVEPNKITLILTLTCNEDMTAVIVGTVVGGSLFIIVSAVVIFVWRSRRLARNLAELEVKEMDM